MEVTQYLDGVAASFFIFALTEQTVGLHIMARHWHGLHHMQTVTTNQYIHTHTQKTNPMKYSIKQLIDLYIISFTDNTRLSRLSPVFLGHVPFVDMSTDVSVGWTDALATHIFKTLCNEHIK